MRSLKIRKGSQEMETRNVREFRNWLKGISFPLGGQQGEGAMPMWHSVPEFVKILPCVCSRRRRLFCFWSIEVAMVKDLRVWTTYYREVFCGTCGKLLK